MRRPEYVESLRNLDPKVDQEPGRWPSLGARRPSGQCNRSPGSASAIDRISVDRAGGHRRRSTPDGTGSGLQARRPGVVVGLADVVVDAADDVVGIGNADETEIRLDEICAGGIELNVPDAEQA